MPDLSPVFSFLYHDNLCMNFVHVSSFGFRDSEEGGSGREESSTEESNGEEQCQDNKVVLQLSNNKPSAYKLRDSRCLY